MAPSRPASHRELLHGHMSIAKGRVRSFALTMASNGSSMLSILIVLKRRLQPRKRIKKWRRAWKIELIERANPDWDDLYEMLNW